jgi:transcriptional regulator with XRE-family HTH domain
MTIGEKIKKLRTDKFMSQSELAGGEITRNMLSQIEHGSATPSLSTVNYLASRLNVSPGFLMANEEDEKIYRKISVIDGIKKAYIGKNYEICYDMCKSFDSEDDEITLILAECSMRVGIEAFCKGELHKAVELFEESVEYCKQSIYSTDSVISQIKDHFAYMEMISPTFSSSVIDECDASFVFSCALPFAVYSSILSEAEINGWENVALLEKRLEFLPEDSMYTLHISARLEMSRDNYENAHSILRDLLYNGSYTLPEPMLYLILLDLETCCKEINDFKGAYEYSSSKIALLQKLLS